MTDRELQEIQGRMSQVLKDNLKLVNEVRKLRNAITLLTKREAYTQTDLAIPFHCGIPGKDLECLGCGGKLYGSYIPIECPYHLPGNSGEDKG
jgi:hypothetical protein